VDGSRRSLRNVPTAITKYMSSLVIQQITKFHSKKKKKKKKRYLKKEEYLTTHRGHYYGTNNKTMKLFGNRLPEWRCNMNLPAKDIQIDPESDGRPNLR
jgi:hypothetical protein